MLEPHQLQQHDHFHKEYTNQAYVDKVYTKFVDPQRSYLVMKLNLRLNFHCSRYSISSRMLHLFPSLSSSIKWKN